MVFESKISLLRILKLILILIYYVLTNFVITAIYSYSGAGDPDGGTGNSGEGNEGTGNPGTDPGGPGQGGTAADTGGGGSLDGGEVIADIPGFPVVVSPGCNTNNNTPQMRFDWTDPSFTTKYYEIWRTEGTLYTAAQGLLARYYPNKDLAGPQLLERVENNIDVDWGKGA